MCVAWFRLFAPMVDVHSPLPFVNTTEAVGISRPRLIPIMFYLVLRRRETSSPRLRVVHLNSEPRRRDLFWRKTNGDAKVTGNRNQVFVDTHLLAAYINATGGWLTTRL